MNGWVATFEPDVRHVFIHRRVAALWVPRPAAGEVDITLADIALHSAGWRRAEGWHQTTGVYSCRVEPDPQHPADQLARDQEIGDERRGGTR